MISYHECIMFQDIDNPAAYFDFELLRFAFPIM